MLQMFQNSGEKHAVNQGVLTMFRTSNEVAGLTDNFKIPFDQLSKGAQLFVTSRVGILNETTKLLALLGYGSTSEVIAGYGVSEWVEYANALMKEWDETISNDEEFQAKVKAAQEEEEKQKDAA